MPPKPPIPSPPQKKKNHITIGPPPPHEKYSGFARGYVKKYPLPPPQSIVLL